MGAVGVEGAGTDTGGTQERVRRTVSRWWREFLTAACKWLKKKKTGHGGSHL